MAHPFFVCRLILIGSVAAIMSCPVAARADDGQYWITAQASGKLGSDAEWSSEVVARFGGTSDSLYELELTGAADYVTDGGLKIGAGYTRVVGYASGTVTRTENRLRQQVGGSLGTMFGGKLTARVRLEERFRSDGNDIGLRLRPQIKFVLPLRKGGNTAFVLSHETFLQLNTTDWGQHGKYERMRNFIGIVTPVAGPVRVEVGYLNQYGIGYGPRADTVDHAASVTLSAGF